MIAAIAVLPVLRHNTPMSDPDRRRAQPAGVAIRILCIAVLATAVASCARGANVDAHKVFSDPKVAELAQAAADGDAARVHELAKRGVDVNAHGDKNVNLLEWALLNKNPKGFEALLDAGAKPEEPAVGGDPVIYMACIANDPVYLEILLKHGVDPSAPRGTHDQTPLMTAAGPNTDAQFQMLLKAGADPNRKNRMGDTALHAAAGAGYAHVLQLLEAGANPRAVNAQGVTFQKYLRMTPQHLLTAQAMQQLAQIDAWLRAHDVPVEQPSGT